LHRSSGGRRTGSARYGHQLETLKKELEGNKKKKGIHERSAHLREVRDLPWHEKGLEYQTCPGGNRGEEKKCEKKKIAPTC